MPDRRGRLHVLVEGHTEETIHGEIIEPHLRSIGWWVSYSIVTTKRPAGGPAFKGGVTNWPQVEREVRLLLRDSSFAIVTSLLDYYAFPGEAPGMADRPSGSPIERVEHVERALRQHFEDVRFVPHLTLHETESWVFAAREQLGDLYGDQTITAKLQRDVVEAGGAEMVNDGPETAPSKRLMRYLPDYSKTFSGPLAICDLGLPALRAECPHLDKWLAQFER